MKIYKIMTKREWADFQKDRVFRGAAIDLEDGYIHFSTAAQAEETAAKHFAGKTDLVLIWGESPNDEALKWELSRGGQQFPHLYRDWHLDEVSDHADLAWNGVEHEFPKFQE